jgi:D-beta-D-heptose 7-phosphate kinase/D-beta-D-heptose 1-phosphate adenosyltransferase
MSTRLIELIENWKSPKVVLVGDFMLDRYIFGRTERVSPEAPIPVLRYHSEQQRLGGAGFVLAGLATLGAAVTPVGICGADEAGESLRRMVSALGADPDGLVATKGRPTVAKVRLLGSSEDRAPQQMMRLDYEDLSVLDVDNSQQILKKALDGLAHADALCLEDYDKGVLAPMVCQKLIDTARKLKIPVFIDPARLRDYSKYAGATMVKLNRPEAERATGLPARDEKDFRIVAEKLLHDLNLEAVVLTLNDLGCFLATTDGTRQMLASRPRQVADATGAGDMVLVTLCLARAGGATGPEAVALANVVGGLEVEKLGCVPITRREIVHDLLAEHHQHAGKVRTLDELLPELTRHRAAGKRIAFTNGCFDLIHLGHVKYFQFAKAQGDLLVVGVNTDASIRRLKGDKRPIIQENDRIGVLEELESIDYIVRFDDDTPMELIRAIRPSVLVKGADYAKEAVVGWDVVEADGGRVALAPLIDGRSTSTVIKRIIEAYSEK